MHTRHSWIILHKGTKSSKIKSGFIPRVLDAGQGEPVKGMRVGRLTAWTNFLSDWTSLNPKKKCILDPGNRVYCSNYDRSSSTAVQRASNSWPLLWGRTLKKSSASWWETRHSELAPVQILTRVFRRRTWRSTRKMHSRTQPLYFAMSCWTA